MSKVRWSASLAVFAVLGLAAGTSAAQEWGKKPQPKPAAATPAPAASAAKKAPEGPKLEWTESFVQATRVARSEDKIILAYFGGSDWCEWMQEARQGGAADADVRGMGEARTSSPLMVDFPSPDKRQSRAIAKQNEILAATYNIAKVPTLLFLDNDGEVIDRVGL